MLDRLNIEAKAALNRARRLALESTAEQREAVLGAEHIFVGLPDESVAGNVLQQLGVSLGAIQGLVLRDWREKIAGDEGDSGRHTLRPVKFSEGANCLLTSSGEEASNLGHNYIGAEHLLLGAFSVEALGNLLADSGLSRDSVRKGILAYLSRSSAESSDVDFHDSIKSLRKNTASVLRRHMQSRYRKANASIGHDYAVRSAALFCENALLDTLPGLAAPRRGRQALMDYFYASWLSGCSHSNETVSVAVSGRGAVEKGILWTYVAPRRILLKQDYFAFWRSSRGFWCIKYMVRPPSLERSRMWPLGAFDG